MNGPYYDTEKAAAYLGMSKAALETMRSKKIGPPYIKNGRSVRYAQSDLEAYMARQQRILTLDSEEVIARTRR